jgi:RHS repeat-associated protein
MKTLQRSIAIILWCMTLIASHARADTITYFHNDLLGSPAAATKEDGTLLWRESYRGYGERIKNEVPSSPNKVWYTSRHQDEDSGLVYMGARYYDPALGRFLSVDSVGFSEQNVHSFNRYAYANNNPYRFKDPDGRLALPVVVTGLFLAAGGVYVANCASCVQSAGRALRTVGGAIRGLGNWAFNEGAEGEAGAKEADTPETKPQKPDGVPEGWNAEPGKKDGNTKWINPDNPHDYVRVKPDGTLTQVRDGQAYDKQGNRVDLKSPGAHGITPDEFTFRP